MAMFKVKGQKGGQTNRCKQDEGSEKIKRIRTQQMGEAVPKRPAGIVQHPDVPSGLRCARAWLGYPLWGGRAWRMGGEGRILW